MNGNWAQNQPPPCHKSKGPRILTEMENKGPLPPRGAPVQRGAAAEADPAPGARAVRGCSSAIAGGAGRAPTPGKSVQWRENPTLLARLHTHEDNNEDDGDDKEYQDHQHLPVLLLVLLCLVKLFQAVFGFDTGLLNIIVNSIKDCALSDKDRHTRSTVAAGKLSFEHKTCKCIDTVLPAFLFT